MRQAKTPATFASCFCAVYNANMKHLLLVFFALSLVACSTATPTSDTIKPEPTEPTTTNRRYISKDPESCKVMRFVCEPQEQYFGDNTGCGCEAIPKQAGEPTICTKEYLPVCGDIQVQCVTTPCDPIPQTFPNRCVATAAGAKNIRGGECE